MKKVILFWFEQYSVASLSETLKKKVSISNKEYPSLNNFGFYMYLDKNLAEIKYIGQAFGNGRSLRNRIRWEITKDGVGCALSRFAKDCQEFGFNKLNLMLKVAHIREATDNGNQIDEINQKLMNTIEMALIHEISKQTNKQQPKMNRRGKSRYRREKIKILNDGSFIPLPKTIKK